MSRRHRVKWVVTVGGGACPVCGQEAVRQRRPGWWDRFGYWLTHGSRAPSTQICPEGHEWVATFHAVNLRGPVSGPRWIRYPVESLRDLLRERKLQPTPMSYLMATGLGVVLGLLLNVVVDWAWWMVAVGFVVLFWVMLLASALSGRRGGEEG